MEEMSLPPCLLVSNEKHPEKQTALTFYSLSKKRFNTVIIPELANKRVLASAYGWLVLMDQDTHNSSLCNPSSMEIIELPEFKSSSFMYDLCVLSKPPTDPDCYILFLSDCEPQLAFCRLGDDEFVIKSLFDDDDLLFIHGAVSLRGEIYCYVEENCNSCFKTVHFTGKTLELRPIFTWDEYPFAFSKVRTGRRRQYLVKSACGAEIFLLSEIMRCRHLHEAGLNFRIFRVDVDRKECEELDNIGNQAIFLSHHQFGGYVFCCSSTKVIMANSIYYTLPNSKNLYRYNLDDQTHTDMLSFTDAGRSTSYWVEYQIFKELIN